MSKYQKGIFYIGNLIQNKNFEKQIYKKNIYFIYDETTDKFISFQDVLNKELDLLEPKLSDSRRNDIEKELDNYKYPYTSKNIEGEIYVDESSIKVIEYTEEKNNKPRKH